MPANDVNENTKLKLSNAINWYILEYYKNTSMTVGDVARVASMTEKILVEQLIPEMYIKYGDDELIKYRNGE